MSNNNLTIVHLLHDICIYFFFQLLEPALKAKSETVYKVVDDTVASATGSEYFETSLHLDAALSTSVTVK